jgi:hypothetical protein
MVVRALLASGRPHHLWLWNLWADPAFPTLVVEMPPERLARAEDALDAHRGELERNDFRRLLRGRLAANSVLGPERVFGFGGPGLPHAALELLTEIRVADGRAYLCEPRTLRDQEALSLGESGTLEVTEWLLEPSLTTRFGARRHGRGLVDYSAHEPGD